MSVFSPREPHSLAWGPSSSHTRQILAGALTHSTCHQQPWNFSASTSEGLILFLVICFQYVHKGMRRVQVSSPLVLLIYFIHWNLLILTKFSSLVTLDVVIFFYNVRCSQRRIFHQITTFIDPVMRCQVLYCFLNEGVGKGRDCIDDKRYGVKDEW